MVGTTVVKLFDGKPFVGTITFYDAEEKYYQVTYSDGDQEELEFDQLRVPEWPQLNRRQVLWLDEKHKKVCKCIYYVSLLSHLSYTLQLHVCSSLYPSTLTR